MPNLKGLRVGSRFLGLSSLVFVLLFMMPLSVSAGTRSKSAFNVTQNINAVSAPANPGDTIVYTLSYLNDSSVTETVTIEDDITDVLYSADLIDAGGGSLSGSSLRFPALSVPAKTRVDRVFKVKIKALPASTVDTLVSNTFGNGVDVRIRVSGVSAASGTVSGAYTAPTTGVSEFLPAAFAAIALFGYHVFRKRRLAGRGSA